MHHDIAKIVIKYLLPSQIHTFFVSQCLSFDMKFKYNIVKCGPYININIDRYGKKIIDISKYKQIVNYFPNIQIIGITIKWYCHYDEIFDLVDIINYINIPLHQITHLNACGNVMIKMCFKSLHRFVNLKVLLVSSCYLLDLIPLKKCVKLRQCDLSHCFLSQDFPSFLNMRGLKVFGIPNCTKYYEMSFHGGNVHKIIMPQYIEELKSFMPCTITHYISYDIRYNYDLGKIQVAKLRSLVLNKKSYVVPYCPKVKYLVIKQSEVSIKSQFPSLKALEIKNVSYTFNMDFISDLQYLNKLVIFTKFILPGMEKISECIGLRHLVIGNINDISSSLCTMIMDIVYKCTFLHTLHLDNIKCKINTKKITNIVGLKITNYKNENNNEHKMNFSGMKLKNLCIEYCEDIKIIIIPASIINVNIFECNNLERIEYEHFNSNISINIMGCPKARIITPSMQSSLIKKIINKLGEIM